MVVTHLPSPVEAQKYRVETIYTGDLEDKFIAKSIANCDPEGTSYDVRLPRWFPRPREGRFFTLSDAFGGTIATGQNANYGSTTKKRLEEGSFLKKIQRTVLMMGRYVEQIPDCPCGNVGRFVGVDQFILEERNHL